MWKVSEPAARGMSWNGEMGPVDSVDSGCIDVGKYNVSIHTFTVLDEDLVGVGVGLAPLLGGVGGHGHGDTGAGVERSASVMQFVDCICHCINWTLDTLDQLWWC